ncbi:hypothetical protein ACK3YP_13150 [Aeromonas allosaccharophila]|uniref:hypothetical protein n=1 Tax=Aeromonas allosaccharophila TaxID=656 RepID=UPI003987AE24
MDRSAIGGRRAISAEQSRGGAVWWCGVVVWWCGGVVVWWCGGVVVWWCGGVAR